MTKKNELLKARNMVDRLWTLMYGVQYWSNERRKAFKYLYRHLNSNLKLKQKGQK